jgi:hypothetical protein
LGILSLYWRMTSNIIANIIFSFIPYRSNQKQKEWKTVLIIYYVKTRKDEIVSTFTTDPTHFDSQKCKKPNPESEVVNFLNHCLWILMIFFKTFFWENLKKQNFFVNDYEIKFKCWMRKRIQPQEVWLTQLHLVSRLWGSEFECFDTPNERWSNRSQSEKWKKQFVNGHCCDCVIVCVNGHCCVIVWLCVCVCVCDCE